MREDQLKVLWSKVDLDLYFRQSKGLQAQLKGLERTIRPVVGWGVYVRLSQLIAEMLVTLPLVQDLRDDAMRERHWKKLMRICGYTEFGFRDLAAPQARRFRRQERRRRHGLEISTATHGRRCQVATPMKTGKQHGKRGGLGIPTEAPIPA